MSEQFRLPRRILFKTAQTIADRLGYHHEQTGGEKWERMGRLQFDFMKARGMEPHHYMLDVGCGTLRGGRHSIRYLQPGRYYGVEKEIRRLRIARTKILPREDLDKRNPQLFNIDDFDFSEIHQTFDFALAQSVINHLTPDLAEVAVKAVVNVLKPGGKFYATFHPGNLEVGVAHRRRPKEVDIAYHSIEWFQEVAGPEGADVEDFGKWGHPNDASMAVFTKRG